MRYFVSEHAYVRAWSRYLSGLDVDILNRQTLCDRFAKAVLAAPFFGFGTTPGSYRCRDRLLTYVFFAHPNRLVLATVFPNVRRKTA